MLSRLALTARYKGGVCSRLVTRSRSTSFAALIAMLTLSTFGGCGTLDQPGERGPLWQFGVTVVELELGVDTESLRMALTWVVIDEFDEAVGELVVSEDVAPTGAQLLRFELPINDLPPEIALSCDDAAQDPPEIPTQQCESTSDCSDELTCEYGYCQHFEVLLPCDTVDDCEAYSADAPPACTEGFCTYQSGDDYRACYAIGRFVIYSDLNQNGRLDLINDGEEPIDRVWGPRDGLYLQYVESNSVDWSSNGLQPGMTMLTLVDPFVFESESLPIPYGESAEVALGNDDLLQLFSCKSFGLEGYPTSFRSATLHGDDSIPSPICVGRQTADCGTIVCESSGGSLDYRYLFDFNSYRDGCTLTREADLVMDVYRDPSGPVPEDWPCPSPWDNTCVYGEEPFEACNVPELRIVATAPATNPGALVDLHLIQAGGKWTVEPDDCSLGNSTPDWGEGGRPILEGSCDQVVTVVDGDSSRQISPCMTVGPSGGQQVITIPDAVDAGSYVLAAEAYTIDGESRIDVLVNGDLIHSEEVTI
ncbi:MAG: hypothetical protein KC561_10935, partial [Myxococcales bacterium]|nr:hypothetical protein [Myxococcales bacterium]